jgi:hypothetical protein
MPVKIVQIIEKLFEGFKKGISVRNCAEITCDKKTELHELSAEIIAYYFRTVPYCRRQKRCRQPSDILKREQNYNG